LTGSESSSARSGTWSTGDRAGVSSRCLHSKARGIALRSSGFFRSAGSRTARPLRRALSPAGRRRNPARGFSRCGDTDPFPAWRR